jgi:hypothetical protein
MKSIVPAYLDKAKQKVKEFGHTVTYADAGFQLAINFESLYGEEVRSKRAFNDFAIRATSLEKVISWLEKYLPDLMRKIPDESSREDFLDGLICELQTDSQTYPAMQEIDADISRFEDEDVEDSETN